MTPGSKTPTAAPSGKRHPLVVRKLNSLARLGMVHLLSGPMPLYVINEFIKSVGSWTGQMLDRSLDVPLTSK